MLFFTPQTFLENLKKTLLILAFEASNGTATFPLIALFSDFRALWPGLVIHNAK